MYFIIGVVVFATLTARESEAACSKRCTFPDSCDAIPGPSPESGEYVLSSGQIVHCDFGPTPCGEAGWTKIADLDMTDTSQNCPSGFNQITVSGVRGCYRGYRPTVGSCLSTTYSAQGQSYSEVCGKVIGYQSGSTNAFDQIYRGSAINDINSYYVDGVSITRGSPREHIFTYAAGMQDTVTVHGMGANTQQSQCPCNDDGMPSLIPDFVGNNYVCESGNKENWISNTIQYAFYPGDPLWDNQSLGPREIECPAPDYFYSQLDSPSTAGVEVRICGDQGTDNEDVLVSAIELYIK